MFPTRISARIAAATLAAALTVGGLFGIGAIGLGQDVEDTPTEEVAATWSFTIDDGDKGWSGTNGATWS